MCASSPPEPISADAQRATIEAQLEEALRDADAAQQQMQSIVDAVRDGILVADRAGNVLFRNAAYGGITGLPTADLAERQLTPAYQLATETGETVSFEQWPIVRVLRGELPDPPLIYQLITCTGKRKVVQIEALPLGSDGMTALQMLRDVTSDHRDMQYSSLLREMAHACAQAIEVREVAEAASTVFESTMRVGNCSIFVRDDAHPGYARLLALHLGPEFTADQHDGILGAVRAHPIGPQAPLLGLRVIATGEPILHGSPLSLPNVASWEETIQSVIYLPLNVGTETFGALGLGFRSAELGSWDKSEHALLLAAADEIALALHRARLFEAARRLARYDALTGLYNHRALQEALTETLAAAARDHQSAGIIMLDVDHFRLFNESHGHDAGDRALKIVADGIRSALRDADCPARYGGEEFTVILPGADRQITAAIAEQIRLAIAARRVQVRGMPEGIPITASLGFAIFPDDAMTPTAILKAADVALYAAKHSGRNQIVGFTAALTATRAMVQA